MRGPNDRPGTSVPVSGRRPHAPIVAAGPAPAVGSRVTVMSPSRPRVGSNGVPAEARWRSGFEVRAGSVPECVFSSGPVG